MIRVPQTGQIVVVADEQRTEEPREQLFAAGECPFVGNSLCKENQRTILTGGMFTHV